MTAIAAAIEAGEETPPPRYLLITGRLSLAALEELRRRVRAAADETAARAELHLREQKGVLG